jgi:hypothetical protein
MSPGESNSQRDKRNLERVVYISSVKNYLAYPLDLRKNKLIDKQMLII